MVWNQGKARVILFMNMGWVEFKFRIWIQKKRTWIWIKPKHGIYSNRKRHSTSRHELTLELKNKLKTQAKQSKNYPKNYHKMIMINRDHGKKMTLRN